MPSTASSRSLPTRAILGHELGVEVVAVGEGVTNVKPGDRCSVEPYLNCQKCIACRRGKPNACTQIQVLGVHADGGMREQFALPARKLHPSAKLTLDQLALVGDAGHRARTPCNARRWSGASSRWSSARDPSDWR